MTDMRDEVHGHLAAGRPLTAAQQHWVVETHDIVQLGMLASDARARRTGTQATFVRVDTVPCDAAAGWEVAPDAGEVRIEGLPMGLDAAADAVRQLRARGAVSLTGFALHDLALAAGPALPEWCDVLKGAGLSAVALARVDRVEEPWLETLASAGLPVQTLAPGTPVVGGTQLALLHQVSTWQARYGIFRAYQPLALEVPEVDPPTGYDDMRSVVTARLLLTDVPHVQVHWTRAGAKLAQACLLFGADDVDGVPARDAMPHGPRRSVLEEVRRNIRAVSLLPVERAADFSVRTDRKADAPA